jgi:hypothetical protein
MTFKSYVTSLSATWKALTAAALLVAALLKFTPLVPPWPDEGGAGASCLAVAACVIGIVISYLCARGNPKRRRSMGVIAMIVAAVLLLVYVYLALTLVVSVVQPVDGVEVTRRVIVGTTLRHSEDVEKTSAQLVELYGLDAGAWTESSLAAARLMLLSVYMAFYVALTLGIGMTQSTARS